MLAEGLSFALYAGLIAGKLCYSTDLQIEPQGVGKMEQTLQLLA